MKNNKINKLINKDLHIRSTIFSGHFPPNSSDNIKLLQNQHVMYLACML